ncbi:hypothetical protein Scep_012681 [Stephania cephalantha]|uniref:phosphoribosylglycinamide formyltransferase 1 n=1 Tax=Stephania cephalantha TaxID=152367 RepID=A0AAP0JFK4_9MAGN
MESRTLISGCSSNSRISLIGRSEKSIDLSLVRSQKLVFLKTQNFSKLDLKWVGARRGVECRSSVERVEGVVGVEDFEKCGGAEYARGKGIPVIVFPEASNSSDGVSAADLVDALRAYGVDFVLLAGYLKLIPVELVRAYPKSILNIHPALLPAFGGKGYYGMKVHKAVIASGARFSGPTVHFVDEHYDNGRILARGWCLYWQVILRKNWLQGSFMR